MFLRNIKNSLIYERPFTRGLFKHINRRSNGEYEDYLFSDSDVKSLIVFPLIPRKIQKQIRLPEMREHIQDVCNLNHLVKISFVYIIYNAENKIVKIINKILDKDRKPLKYDKALCIFSNNENIEPRILDKSYDCLEMYLTSVANNINYNHWTYDDIKNDFNNYYNKCIGKNKRKNSFDEERNIKIKLDSFNTNSYGSPPAPTSSYGPPPAPTSSYGPPPPPTSSYGPPPPPTSSYYDAIHPSQISLSPQHSFSNGFDSNYLSISNGQQISNTFASNAFLKNIEMETKLTFKEREYSELYEQHQKLINKNKLYYDDNCEMILEIRSLKNDNRIINEKYKDKKYKYGKEIKDHDRLIEEHKTLQKLFKSKLTEIEQKISNIEN